MADAREVTAQLVEAFNSQDQGWIRSLYADRAVLDVPGEGRLEGADAAVDYLVRWLAAFPDARLAFHDDIVDDDWVAHRLTLQGTHAETFVGRTSEIPATHRPMRVEGAALARTENGQIRELQLFFDQAALGSPLLMERVLDTKRLP